MNSLPKKFYLDIRNDNIGELFYEQKLPVDRIALIYNLTPARIRQILQEYRFRKKNELAQLKKAEQGNGDGRLPCNLSLDIWPRCSGQGCYHAEKQKCPALLAYVWKNRNHGAVSTPHASSNHWAGRG